MCSRLSVYPMAERRLRPIYDWLDSGNNKKALQEAEKVLKKQPTLLCAKVLKCLALLRLGKENESMEQLEDIRKICPTEETTLQLMTVCYREVHKPDLICQVYESANQKEPGNEEILTNLFLSYVRVGDFKKQQTTAMMLYKVKQKNLYYFWIIISILIQTTDKLSNLMPFFVTSPSSSQYNKASIVDNSKSVVLRLAEKMVEKHVTEKKMESDQEVLIYVIILEMQGRLKEALDVINGELGKKLEITTVINKRIDLLMKMEEWAEANELLKSALMDDIDAWNYILLYLDTVFHLGKGQDFNLGDENSPFYKAKEFLCQLMKENRSSNIRKRGPYLAQLEFYSRMVDTEQLGDKIIDEVVECMLDFIKEFGTKESCLHDLRPYLYLAPFLKFLPPLSKLATLKHDELPQTRGQMNLCILNFEMSRVFGIRENFMAEEKLRFVNKMIKHFIHGLQFNCDLPSTETRSNDRYMLLAIHALYELWADTEQSNYLFEAIVLSHYALYHSPSNSQFKILLVKFYHLLGGSKGAHNAYISLDLKHMQLDTLGYLHVFPLLANAEYTHAKSVLYCTLKFFTNNFKESADHITFAYKYDALTKIPEFIHIREKLNYSTHYRQATLERMLLDIFLAQSHSSTIQIVQEMTPIDKIEWSLLQDNRDFTVLWDIEADSRRLCNSTAIQITYLQEIVFLRLRSLLLQLCAACLQLGSCESETFQDTDNGYDSEGSNISSNYFMLKSTLHKLTVELENNLRTLQTNVPNHISSRYIAGPPDSRLLMIVQCNYFDPILNELKFILSLLPGEHSDKEKAHSHLDATQLFFKEFFNIISNELVKCDNAASKNLVIQMCALFVELISFSCIIAGVCESILKKYKQWLTKKNKKKKETVQKLLDFPNDYDWRADVVLKFINAISSFTKNLEMVLRTEEKNWKEKNIKIGELAILSDIDDDEEVSCLKKMIQLVNENLNLSYSGSISNITSVLKQKLKYIGCHKV